MGKVITKKIRGMGWTAKVGLVLFCTLLATVFMCQGLLKTKQAFAAAFAQSGWGIVTGAHTANLSQAVNYIVGTGPNRLLLVGVTSKLTAAAIQSVTTATYGGVPLVEAVSDKTTSAQVHTYLFYLTDNAVMDGTAKSIVVTLSGGTAAMTDVYAAVYNGVDQITPITDAKNRIVTSSTSVALASPGLTINSGDQAVALFNIIRAGSTSTPSISSFTTSSSWSTTGAPTQTSTTSPATATYALSRLVQTVGPDTISTNVNNAADITSLSALSIKPAANAPVITSVSPTSINIGDPATTVTITGTGLTGTSAVTFSGTLVTAGTPTVVDDTQVTVPVTAAAGASAGDRTMTVTTPVALGSKLLTGFAVSNLPAPTVTALSAPVTGLGQGGNAQNVTITGTNFVTGATSNFGTGVTVNSTTYVSATQLTANITVTTSATAGLHDVVVTNPDTKTGTGTGLLTVNARPTVLLVSPFSALQGANNQVVTILGTGFNSGASLAAAFSGTGITVNSTTFVDFTHLSANITVAPAASTGTRTITVTNGDTGASAASSSIFNILASAAAMNITSISPYSLGQGVSNATVEIYGTGFASGATVTFSSSRVTVNSTSFVDSTHLTANITTSTSSAQSSNVTVTNPAGAGGATFTATPGFYINSRPTVTTVTPASGLSGNAYDLTFVGTNFQPGAAVTFSGSGVTVSNVNVASATSMTAHIVIGASPTYGVQTVTVTNPDQGFNTVSFNVASLNSPTITSISPNIIGQGATGVNVTINGTNFVSGATVLFGTVGNTNFTTNSVTFVSSTQLTANLTVGTGATAGTNNTTVTVTNPSGEAALATLLSITARPGSPTLTPANGTLGTTFNIAITGSTGLAAGPGFGVTVSGTGVTVNSSILNSATSATANVTIDPSYLVAPLGARTLSLINGDYGTRTATFTIRGNAPTVVSASPAIRRGAVNQDVTIVGTNFYPGAVATFSNTGVTVNSTTWVDTATVRANITVDGAATTGTSNITVTNSDTQAATGTGIFTVAAAPTVTSNAPLSSGQGSTLDVTINGTSFVSGATVLFSGTGITVNSVSGSGTTLTANITIDPAALLTTRSISVINPDGSNAAGGSFTVLLPASTITAPLVFSQVTETSITVLAPYTNDSNNNNSCTILWGTSPGSYPNSVSAVRGSGYFTATVNGLTGGADGEGKAYYFQATYGDADGVTGTNPVMARQNTLAKPLMHNSQNLNSGKWSQGWGVDGAKYGAFTCSTCHSENTINSKMIAGSIQTPSLENWSSAGSSTVAPVVFTKVGGGDGPHATSDKVCEVCHSRTSHNLYNNPAVNHEGTRACTDCHSHKQGFLTNCIDCHSVAQNNRRQVVGNGGDFFTNMTAHVKSSSISSLSCMACHDSVGHKTQSDGVSVKLRNADGGPSVIYDGTSATASAVKDICISCHDANGASTFGANARTPFAPSGDANSPANIGQYWPATGGAHNVNMVCFNCHGNSKGVDGSTSNPKYNGHASGTKHILQDMAYDVVNPNNYCFNCHNSASTDPNKSSKNIAGQMALASKHTTAKCFDCHGDEGNSINSMHSLRAGSQVNATTIANNVSNATGRNMTWSGTKWNGAAASTPLASGTVTAEYQICFKCHAATGTGTAPDVPGAGTAAASLTNLALEFNPNNASGHPVVAGLNNYPNSLAPKALSAAKLASPWNVNMGTQLMSCTDCHATNSTASKGPHGSSVKWMLTGVNKAWPYTSAANNGTSTGTYFAMSNKSTGLGTDNGLFCMNCHTVTNSNGFHTAVNGFTTHQSFAMNCVSCHIRVPHGGKISRLLNTVTNVPARYMGDGNGTNVSGSRTITKFSKGGATAGGNFTCSNGEHSGGTEAW